MQHDLAHRVIWFSGTFLFIILAPSTLVSPLPPPKSRCSPGFFSVDSLDNFIYLILSVITSMP